MTTTKIGYEEMRDWIAENVMGFERKRHQGTMGGGDISMSYYESGKVTTKSSHFFWCAWCRLHIDRDSSGLPCLNYPFPNFTVIDLAVKCQRPISLISYPGKHRTYWTVTVGDHKVDVETPLEGLCYILWSEGR